MTHFMCVSGGHSSPPSHSMGCCGGDPADEDDPLLLPLNPNPSSSSSPILSPMNSHFAALTSRDLLRTILSLLPPRDLARAACVAQLWRAIASDRDIQEFAFRSPYNVARVLGDPSSPAFWRHPALHRFAISHRLRRADTIASLAINYDVQVRDIKRLNNMMSDHGIHSRERLLIPISKADLLYDSTCYIELDAHAKREVAVLYLEGGPDGQAGFLSNKAISERSRRKVLNSVKRSMQVDDGTAEYYLSVTNGDPRAALLQFSDDLRWDQQRSAP